jgi:hypothetical protein
VHGGQLFTSNPKRQPKRGGAHAARVFISAARRNFLIS